MNMYHRDVTCLTSNKCGVHICIYVYFSHIIFLECFTKRIKAEIEISLSTNRLRFLLKQNPDYLEQLKNVLKKCVNKRFEFRHGYLIKI